MLELKERAVQRLVKDARKLTAEARRARLLEREVAAILRELDEQSAVWIAENVPKAYLQGVREANAQLPAGLSGIAVSPAVHQQAVQALVDDMQDALAEATRQIGKNGLRTLRRMQVRRELDRQITRELALGVVEGKTRREVSNEVTRRLIDEFGDGPIQVGGRSFTADQYAELVVRTKSREAATAGTVRRLVEVGEDLVQVSASGATDGCAFYEGKVFSISGTSERYPPLDSMPNGGPPFHPNCRHVLFPFIEELASERELDRVVGVPASALGKSFPEVNKLARRVA
jgi:hypothetical protein